MRLRDLIHEDLRAWFGTGGKGGVGGGGWDRYNSSGDRVGKCGDAKEGDAYAACLSKEKARKLGKDGRAAFVKRKRAAQSKGGDAKKGGEQNKGQKPIKVKTGVKENISVDTAYNKIDSLPQGKIFDDAKRIDGIFDKSKHSYSEVIEVYEKNKNNSTTQFVSVKDIHITQPNIQSNKVKQTITSFDDTDPLNVVQFPDEEMAIYDGHHRLTAAWALGKNKIKVNLVKIGVKEEMTPEQSEKIGMPFKGKHSRDLKENFADGKNPGRKGLSKQFGISQKMSIAQLEKIAKTATGERRRMAQWNLNMKRGRMKKENLDPNTFKDTGKAAPYGSGYKELEERLNLFLEKNIPTDPGKWSYYTGRAKETFDVYPSAYALAWAAKKYKKAGGRWRKGK